MKNLSKAALLAAGATVMSSAPKGVFARPRADGADPAQVIAQIQQAWQEHKTTVESNLGKKADDAVVQASLTKINGDLDKMLRSLDAHAAQLAAVTAGAGGGNGPSPEAAEHATAFNAWFRRGDAPANMRELEVKAKLTTQSDPDGGYVVPVQMDAGIDRVLGTVSAIRSISRVVNVGTSTYKKLVSMGGATSGWVGEENARPETDTPKLREVALATGEIYANPAATQTMLDDGMFDVEAWLAGEVAIEFAEQEGAAFVNGNGVNKPRGFLTYDTVANANYGTGKNSAFGKLGYVATGTAGGFGSAPADPLIDLYFALRSGYRNGATFVTSDAVMATVRKMKDGQGNYLWAPPSGPDMPSTILGKPVVTDDNMPALANGSFSIAFGNFQRGYTIADRAGARILRDPYSNKPFVTFYTTKRVGGGVTQFETIKLLKFATS